MERRDVAPTVAEILAAAKLLKDAVPLRKTVILCSPEGEKLLKEGLPEPPQGMPVGPTLAGIPVEVFASGFGLHAEAMRRCNMGEDVFLVTKHGVVGPDGVRAIYEWSETWGDRIPGTSFLWRTP